MVPENHDDDRTMSIFPLSIGSRIGQYRIVSEIGAGGMGIVYYAEDTTLDRKVALKFLSPQFTRDNHLRSRFLREAQAAAALNHKNIVTIYEIGEHRGNPYIAMEYAERISLRSYLGDRQLPLATALDFAVQIGEGLQAAHKSNIIHRDIKPSNIMVGPDGRLKILDFGLAGFLDRQDLTMPGQTMGTPGYMSPEQTSGEQLDRRSDIFSFGVVLYELISGQSPFKRDTSAATLTAIREETPRPLRFYRDDTPEDLQSIVDKCLAKKRNRRYDNIDDLLPELVRLRDSLMSTASAVGSTGRRFMSWRAWVGLALAAIAVGTLSYIVSDQTQRHNTVPGFDVKVPLGERHLAVLPFVPIGSSTADQAFCDGLMETLANKLTQMEKFQRKFWVVPISEIRELEITSVRQAREAFGATHVVTGSVQRIGDNVHITINLVDAVLGRQLASADIAGDSMLTLHLQDSTVLRLAALLEVELTPDAQQYLTAGSTGEPAAYDCYLKGLGYLKNDDNIEQIDSAIVCFRHALAKDTSYVLAYAGIGEAYLRKYNLSPEPEYIRLARENCEYAVSLDSTLEPALTALGRVYNTMGRYDDAVSAFRTLVARDLHSQRLYRGMAESYEALGQLDTAEATYRRAISLRPDYWKGYEEICFFYIRQGRFQEALAELRAAETCKPEGYRAWNNLGGLYFHLDQKKDARIMFQRSLDIAPNYGACSNLATLYFMDHEFVLAADMYERALTLNDRDYQVWGNLGSALYWIPERRDESLATYWKAIEMAEEQRRINPKNLDILSDLSEFYAKIGRMTEARILADSIIQKAPQNIDLMLRAGVVYEQLGDRDTALELIGKAIQCGYPLSMIESIPDLEALMADERFRLIYQSDRRNNDSDSAATLSDGT